MRSSEVQKALDEARNHQEDWLKGFEAQAAAKGPMCLVGIEVNFTLAPASACKTSGLE